MQAAAVATKARTLLEHMLLCEHYSSNSIACRCSNFLFPLALVPHSERDRIDNAARKASATPTLAFHQQYKVLHVDVSLFIPYMGSACSDGPCAGPGFNYTVNGVGFESTQPDACCDTRTNPNNNFW
jgi:hypothetical protein